MFGTGSTAHPSVLGNAAVRRVEVRLSAACGSPRGQDALRALCPGRQHARDRPALEHDLRLVGRDRDPLDHGRHERPDGGREYHDQEHQTDRTRIP